MKAGMYGTGGGYRFRREYTLLLILFMGIGVWLRVRNLGDLSLIVDEGVQVLAVEAILRHGIPTMDSGLVYLRGPLYLYMQAGLAYLFDLNEFWLRLPSVIWGVAAIVPTYLLGRELFNRPVGVLSAAVIAFSVWEIEMSRYARVYIAFQFFFLVALICFYRGFMLDERRFKIWFLVSAFFAFLTHELSQVLVTLFLIPLFSASFTWKRKLKLGYWAVGLGALLFVQQKITGFRMPEGSSFPSEGGAADVGLIDQITSALGVPALNGPDMSPFFHALQQETVAVTALGLVVGMAMVYLFYQLYRKKRKGGRVALGLLMLGSAFVYQFGLVAIFFVVYLAFFARDRHILRDRVLIAASSAAFVCFGGWFIILATSAQLLIVEVPLVLFGFPALYKYLIRWLAEGWPVMTAILAVGSVWLFVRFLRDRRDVASLFLLGALYLPALFASLFESDFVSIYTLHLYPLIVLIFAFVVWRVGTFAWRRFSFGKAFSGRLAFLCGLPIILLMSQDANPLPAWQVGDRTYQSETHPVRNATNFRFYNDFHQDLKSPGLFVKAYMGEQDRVAVIGPDYMAQLAHYYTGNVDYVLTPEEKARKRGLMKQGDHIHYTMGSAFITDRAELEALIQEYRGRLWIVGDRRILREDNPYHPDEEVKERVRDLVEQPDYVGRDGITFALKVR